MSDEQDFSLLPVADKLAHNVWKVRLDGYTTLIAEFENSRNDQDPCFGVLNSRADALKSLVLDLNVVAQELAVLLVCKYLEYGCSAANVGRLKTSGIVLALCEKGLASNRAGTKAKSVDALLLLVDVSGSADWIVDQILPYLENRLPKLVAGCVHALYQLVLNFGCVVVPPKPVIPALSKLFAHADRNVRAETTKLTVELYIWLRDGLTLLLFDSLKPVQQRDLTTEFSKVQDTKPEQKRLTRAQQEQLAARQSASATLESADVAMDDVSDGENAAAFDPFDMMDPVEVLSKLPADLYVRAASTKWKDRVEVLEETQLVLSKAPKLVHDDYIDLVRLFAKCFKDANIQVVQLAANGVEALAKGLKDGFLKYRGLVLAPIIERSKEKKPAVAEALASALDAIFASSSLLDVLEETLAGMKHKTPQVKISSTNYLQRCLANTPTPPKTPQIDLIMQVGVKLLTDSQEPIRQASTEMVGTLMKITGERELKSLLEKVDDNRLAKVRAVFETVTVKASSSKPAQRPTSAPKPGLAPAARLTATPALKKPTTTSQAIPSKRLATSPAKRADIASKVPVKGFTGRLLISPTVNGQTAPPPTRAEPVIPPELLEELRLIKEENRRLKEENTLGLQAQTALLGDLQKLKEENSVMSERLERLYNENTNGNLMVKQKDAQIMRLTSDLENAKLKIRNLDQEIEMIKLQQPTMPQASRPLQRDAFTSPFTSPARFSLSRVTLSELSSRVNRLSIEGGAVAPNNIEEQPPAVSTEQPDAGTFTRGITTTSIEYPLRTEVKSLGDGEENWRKATEVTAQLKARIEKMKQRNRLAK